jgi:hypothetical protein
LIDDREKLREGWEKAGGIFVLHTSARSTLDKLRRRRILPIESIEEPRQTEKIAELKSPVVQEAQESV